MTERKPDHARYSKVTRRMWYDATFLSLSGPAPNGRDCFIRLLTAPELGPIPGLFQAWPAGIAQSLGWTTEGFGEALREVIDKGMARLDERVGLFWLPNAIKHNEPESPNTVRGWKRAWRELPDSPLKDEAQEHLLAYLRARGEAWERAFLEVLGLKPPSPSSNPSGRAKPTPKASVHPSPEASSNQEQEQEQEQEGGTRARAMRPDPFLATFRGAHPDDAWVFERWCEAFGVQDAVFDSRRCLAIQMRREAGMTRQDALDALEGAKADPYVNGDKDGNRHFRIQFLFGDQERFEEFRDRGRALRQQRDARPRPRPRTEPEQFAAPPPDIAQRLQDVFRGAWGGKGEPRKAGATVLRFPERGSAQG